MFMVSTFKIKGWKRERCVAGGRGRQPLKRKVMLLLEEEDGGAGESQSGVLNEQSE